MLWSEMIIPSIDLMDGKAVQLKQGKEKVLEKENVLELAKEFRKYGEIAVIDLDAALGKGDNLELIKKICKIADCRVGGGIRTIEKAKELLNAGAKKIIIGTKASPEFLKQLPKEKLIVAIDTKDDYVVDKGWTRKTEKTPEEAVKKLEGYCSEFLFTNVNKEGLMKGFDLDKVKKLKELTKNKITVAGGITTVDDIKKIEDLGCNSQIGMALYTGKINLEEAFNFIHH
jgi:phosphoribosyl-ATP pyrophosphohydrolase/phosphoribosyl-AMP cyclohydrolase